jgi:hypothetical protein
MTVHWLLDANVFDAYYEELAAAIQRCGHVAKSIHRPAPPYDWDDVNSSYRKLFPEGACVVTHADIDLVQRVQADRLWTPGAFATVEHFFCSHYYAHFGPFLLNRDYMLLPFAELARREDFLFETFGREGKIFVRPDSPLKLFTGLIVTREKFARDLEFMAFYEFPMESLVVVSTPKTIVREWRFVIANQLIIAGSQYKSGDDQVASPTYDPRALEMAQRVLALGYAPDPVWVLDICETSDGEYHLLEIGGFSFANLYGCDKDAVARAVSEVALKLHQARD